MDVVSTGQAIYGLLDSRSPRPLKALKRYQNALERCARSGDALAAKQLKDRFGKLMDLLELAHIIKKEDLQKLIRKFTDAGNADQDRLLIAIVDRLFALGEHARKEPASPARQRLEGLGLAVKSLVLEGTLQQQFFCKVATRMGFPRRVREGNVLVDVVAVHMIAALGDVIRLGAETTRDSAIEGMGALLQLVATHQKVSAESLFPDGPAIDHKLGKPKVNEMYEQRLERRKLMVLAIADPVCREKLLKELEEDLGDKLSDVRKGLLPNQKNEDVWRELETVLYRRHDLLRVLPAIARQNDVGKDMSRFVAMLQEATSPLKEIPRDPDPIVIAHARFRESVFRTIDNLMRRDAPLWKEFDPVVTAAVRAIPLTMTGTPRVCNARVRTTVSILRTAVRIVVLSDDQRADTKVELLELFQSIGKPRLWLNPGVAEACYRALPELLRHEIHDKLYEAPLEELFVQLTTWPVTDLADAHRKLIVTSCFRRILVSLADSVYERHLQRDADEATRAEEHVEDELRRLLSQPTAKAVTHYFENGDAPDWNVGSSRGDIDVNVIAAIGHESEMLQKLGPKLQKWKDHPPEERLLLTRILALQLHALSRDAQEVARHERLSAAFAGMAPAAMTYGDAMKQVWTLLAELHPDAAEAADPDIQRFVEYRGRRYRADEEEKSEEKSKEEKSEDLPGYVLAMISRDASDRIAGAIAREIDLDVRHLRDNASKSEPKSVEPDFAESLYQVMQRGPHESIFHHLMPRIGGGEHDIRDRQIVQLFESHVKNVLEAETKPARELIEYLSSHVQELSGQLNQLGGLILTELAKALKIFGELTSEEDDKVWAAIQEDKLAEFFHTLDKLDARARKDDGMLTMLDGARDQICKDLEGLEKTLQPDDNPPWRSLLIYRHFTRLVDLRTRVKHYVDLPVENFSARAIALEESASIVEEIEKDLKTQELLQPPKRVLLIALMAHLRDVFDRTTRWYCIEARRRIDKNEKEAFWIVYASDTSKVMRPLTVWTRIARFFRSKQEIERFLKLQKDTAAQIADLTKAAGKQPPRFDGQIKRYEDFAVNWMASDLDLEALWIALHRNWPPAFALLFKVITRPLLALTVIMLPFLWAAGFHRIETHWLEGLGFWFVAAGIVVPTLAVLARLIWVVALSKLAEWKKLRPFFEWMARRRSGKPPKNDGYLFRSLLPQLVGCIAAPMALIAKFDHSYSFSFSASGWAMLLLLLLAFLATRFYLEREVVDRTSSSPKMSPRDRRKVTKVLGVTISQAFGIAVLLSVIFADSHYRVDHEQKKHNEALKAAIAAGGTEEEKKVIGEGAILVEHGAITPSKIESPHDPALHDFVGYIPHQAFLEWQKIKIVPGWGWNDWVKKHGNFTYYPTIILSWTALGLFFGLVLEGIDKGEHLRRRGAKESHG